METKNKVIDYLQWSSDQYEQRYFQAYWNWCQQHGQYPSIIQQLMANSRINSWFNYEYGKLEKNFVKIYETLPNLPIKALEEHYKVCTAPIIALYPQPLIEEIKRNRDFSNLIVTNTPIYYAN